MKFLINARFVTQTVTGVQRYAIKVVEQFDNFLETGRIDRDLFEIQLLSPTAARTQLDTRHIPRQSAGLFKGQLWEQLDLPRLAGDRLVWSPCNIGPLACTNQVITIHDTSPLDHPAWFDWRFALWYRFLIPRLARRAQMVITDSTFSKSRILFHTGIQPEQVIVVPAGVEDRFQPLERSPSITPSGGGQLPDRYLLYVGSLEPRKNLENLLTAWEMASEQLSDVSLVVAGTTGRAFHRVGFDHLPPRTIFVGYINDDELVSLYQNALAFLYPSLYEGFGLPPLEAMACGTPVLTSPVASLPEVVGDSALLVDPLNPESIRAGIQEIVLDKKLRSRLREKGLAQARAFTWERTALEVWKVIQSQLSKRVNNQ